MDDKLTIQIAIGLFTILNAGFLFLWNNIRADIRELKVAIDLKASKVDVDERRQDIKELFERDASISNQLSTMERNLVDRINNVERSVIDRIATHRPTPVRKR